MLVFPNCKINLGLRIGNKRPDGYHNLETVFFPLPFTDVLEIIPALKQDTEILYTGTGLVVDGTPADNLCIRAYHLLKQDFPQIPAVRMHLHKAIPLGAGLGGGSADAAFTLNLLNSKFRLGLNEDQLIRYALQLGSDCPFFLLNKPSFATGRGEVLEPVAVDLSACKIVLINPGIHINTGWAFAKLSGGATPSPNLRSLKDIVAQPLLTWKHELINDFEKPVFEAHPGIGRIKEDLYNAGALYAAMSGSGSTVFGIFEKNSTPSLPENQNYFIKIIN